MNEIDIHLARERWKDDIAKAIQQLVIALLKAEDAPCASISHAEQAQKALVRALGETEKL